MNMNNFLEFYFGLYDFYIKNNNNHFYSTKDFHQFFQRYGSDTIPKYLKYIFDKRDYFGDSVTVRRKIDNEYKYCGTNVKSTDKIISARKMFSTANSVGTKNPREFQIILHDILNHMELLCSALSSENYNIRDEDLRKLVINFSILSHCLLDIDELNNNDENDIPKQSIIKKSINYLFKKSSNNLTPNKFNPVENNTQLIRNAIQNDYQIKFHYQKFNRDGKLELVLNEDGSPFEYTFSPYYYGYVLQHLYCIGCDTRDGFGFRTYRLDRMRDITPIENLNNNASQYTKIDNKFIPVSIVEVENKRFLKRMDKNNLFQKDNYFKNYNLLKQSILSFLNQNAVSISLNFENEDIYNKFKETFQSENIQYSTRTFSQNNIQTTFKLFINKSFKATLLLKDFLNDPNNNIIGFCIADVSREYGISSIGGINNGTPYNQQLISYLNKF